MSRFLVIFVMFCLTCAYSLPIANQPHQISDKISTSANKVWIDEPMCVLKMGESCPSGFVEDQMKLSVQTDVNPRDTDQKGNILIKTGKAGASSLERDTYDALYTLTLVTCCK